MEHGADDFDTVDDLYEAIGDMLLEVDGKGEDDIRQICDRLMEVMKRYKSASEIIFSDFLLVSLGNDFVLETEHLHQNALISMNIILSLVKKVERSAGQ